MDQSSITTNSTRWHRVVHQYRVALLPLWRSPAAWIFGAAWLFSASYLLLTGYGADVLPSLGLLLMVMVLSLLTLPLTRGAPLASPSATPRVRVWVQLAIVLVFVLFTGYRGLLLNGAVSVKPGSLPLVTPLIVFLARFPLDVINPLLYCVLPLLFFLLAGLGLREVGFAPGYRTSAVTLLWVTPLLAVLIVSLLGGARLPTLGLALLHNSLRNGFFEEFLFRGALLAVLVRLLDRRWSIVLSALLFGLWHLATNTVGFGGNFLAGAAFGVVDQAVIGLGLALVVSRTHNLLASSVIHVLLNTAFG